MKYKIFALSLLVLVLTIVFTLLLNTFRPKEADGKIVIVRGDPVTGKLKFDPDTEIIYVYKFFRAKWSVKEGSNVDSFWIEPKGKNDIFIDNPPNKPCKKGNARVSPFTHDNEEYDYAIHWAEKDNNPNSIYLKHDPKIAVKPSFSSPIQILLAFILSLAGVYAINAYRKTRNSTGG